jgi:predicted O-linked N-acetylglucosamine transferase (SPINDLY family)|tara:strand:+ start:34 stop:1914 length:1881 start_codon:yes stop_codon:yes gene_type:complete
MNIKMHPKFKKAILLFQKREFKGAKNICDEILEIEPKNFDVMHLYGIICYQTKDYALSAELINKAVKINSNNAEAYNNLGIAFKKLNKFDSALESLNQAIKINPKFFEAYNIRGLIFIELERLNEALESLNKALEINPNYAEAYYNQGNLLCEMKKFNEAISSYNKAIKINPNLDYLLGRLIFSKHCISEWKSFAKDLKDISDKILKKYKICTPLQSLRFFDSPELQKITAQTYVKEKYSDKNDLIHITNKKLNKKIRIGYYSADFYNHAMSSLLTNLYELHDKSKFELFAFSFGPERKDEMYYRISAAFDQFIDVKLKSDDEIMKLSRELKIDVAIDLMTFTQYHRFEIFTKRCAPIQINYLGYPGTSGASCFDYIIADKTLIPKKNQKYYSEKIIYLPDTYQVNDSKRKISDKVFTRKELSLPKDSFVFCCFNQSSKINPEIFYIWMNLLKSINNSVLWILPQNEIAVKNLQKEATIRNVNPDRIKFAQDMEMSEHLARHKAADLFIDTFPYNAHTTASDALWAGLPVLTLMGESFASRVAGSLLNAIDLPELITHTKKEYEDKAIELANNKSLLNEIRNKLNKNRLIKPLFNTKLFTKNLEKAYLMIYEKYINNKKPENIEIK